MKNIIFLICITTFAVFLRFNNLSSVPPSASLDEVAIGYNAYSILKTGADEYSTKFPILLRAYDDWRPALYVYLVIPFVKFLGLNVLAVRLPSVILSVLTIVATYFLVCELIRMSKLRMFANAVGLVSSFLLAISPWHIYISRLGHEVNAGFSFTVFAILFFLKAINSKKNLFLILSFIFLGLTLYTYQSEKIFIPLITLILIFVFRNSLLKMKKGLLVCSILAIIISIPIIFATLSPQGLIRFKGTSTFTQGSLYKESAQNVLKYKNEGNLLGQVINNRRLVPLKIFINNYLSHLNPKFIFLNSGSESFKAPNFGLLYIWELPFLIVGFIFGLKVINRKANIILASWLLIALVAPSLATGAPHAMRAFNALPVPQIFTAFGIFFLVNFLKKYKVVNYIFYILFSFITIYYLNNFYKEYFYEFPKNQSSSFQYSLHSAIKYVLNNEKYYDKIIFSNKDNLYQSYMFYLFKSKYDPYLYQKQGGTKSGGFAKTHEFGKFEFRPIVWNDEEKNKKNLYIGNLYEVPLDTSPLFVYQNLDGKRTVVIWENKNE